jgi:L-rhamnose mutarotase
MQLHQGSESEYDKAHAAIWPELVDQMVADGILSFNLFRSGVTIFAIQERKTPFPDANTPPTALSKRWWSLMAKLMIIDAQGRPIRTELQEIFSLESTLKSRGAPP